MPTPAETFATAEAAYLAARDLRAELLNAGHLTTEGWKAAGALLDSLQHARNTALREKQRADAADRHAISQLRV
ncbi:hypothetical protein LJ737_20920 [Hymenobacter sp. 15J16-1T3B]|uniref:hypothetical protein n=1 Tax=Hymenobacter sp. 15J16-1T3B TaxID=2886941 RepID=UPI001D0F8BEB|nr:hypothetical protein [Hymenobacter sp. 15J16-1T3B]MCC3159717.1 hypothetical protein [Hymenobacter sp. 15J16-1T3B]